MKQAKLGCPENQHEQQRVKKDEKMIWWNPQKTTKSQKKIGRVSSRNFRKKCFKNQFAPIKIFLQNVSLIFEKNFLKVGTETPLKVHKF